jgi:hypothetical protein
VAVRAAASFLPCEDEVFRAEPEFRRLSKVGEALCRMGDRVIAREPGALCAMPRRRTTSTNKSSATLDNTVSRLIGIAVKTP